MLVVFRDYFIFFQKLVLYAGAKKLEAGLTYTPNLYFISTLSLRKPSKMKQ